MPVSFSLQAEGFARMAQRRWLGRCFRDEPLPGVCAAMPPRVHLHREKQLMFALPRTATAQMMVKGILGLCRGGNGGETS